MNPRNRGTVDKKPQLMVKNCDGGHYCSPPKECCRQGCCYLPDITVYRPPVLQAGNMFTPLFLGHWYFWAAVTATVAGILCACSLWRRHSQSSFCCRESGRDERASEPDSNGSCYAPPQYSRCSSFHQAPPPYAEVTSKPDLYPLVINCNGDTALKSIGNSTGYLMVQYFRNFIVRPVGSLSATSTIDSLSSSFICSATNEANMVIPPPYSCTGSLEEVTISTNNNIGRLPVPNQQFARSASSLTCNDFQIPRHSPSSHSHISAANSSSHSTNSSHTTCSANKTKCCSSSVQSADQLTTLLIRSNPCYVQGATNFPSGAGGSGAAETNEPKGSVKLVRKLNFVVLSKERSVDSESQEDDHNFSDLLNLSVCAPSSVTHIPLTTTQNNPHELQQSFSVTNSMTSSDISSLANLGTPDSPPRATSPTLEMKELLDKIQQLPQQKSPLPPDTPNHHQQQQQQQQQPKTKGYFHRTKAKTLYMPLYEGATQTQSKSSPGSKVCTFGNSFVRSSRGWLSRSAPSTPCGNMAPSFPSQRKSSGSQKGSKARINDGSPLLLNENEESDEDRHGGDECL